MIKDYLLKANGWLFLVLITLIPFSFGYVWREPLAISYLNLLSVAFLILTLINLVLGSLHRQKINQKSLVVLIVLMFLMLIWGSLFSHPWRSILGPWTSRFLQPLLVGYSGYLLLKSGQLKLSVIAGALWVSLALIAGHGLLQWIDILPSNNASRLTGLYAFPNSFARYVEILLLLLWPYLVLSKDRFRPLQLLIWLAGLLVLVGTVSYAGIGSFIVGLTTIIAFLPKSFRRLKIVYIVILLVAILGGGVYRTQLPKYQATTTTSRESRQQFWQVAWATIKEHPLTGIGLEGWERQYPELARKHLAVVPIEPTTAQPHNIYLDATLRAGLLGLIAIMYLLFWPIVITVRLAKEGLEKIGEERWLVLGVLGYATAMVVFGLVDDPIFSDDVMLMLFIIYLTLSSVCGRKSGIISSNEP